MQPFTVGTCLGDAFEALVAARRSLVLVLVAASPLLGVAAYALTGSSPPLWTAALIPAVDLLLATIVTAAVVAALYDRQPRILAATLRRVVPAALVMALIYLVVLALGVAAAVPLLDEDRYKRDLATAGIMFAIWMLLSAILYTRWFVAIPAAVVEKHGPVAALRRSDGLTRGHRGHLFAILALLGTFAFGGLALLEVRLDDDALLYALVLLGWLPLSVIRAAISATAYAQLRADKEAGDPEQLGEVFA